MAGEPRADLVARSSRLRGVTVGGDVVPRAIDELPLVASLGLFAEGVTEIRDAARASRQGERPHRQPSAVS